MLNMHTVIEAYTYVMACISANHRICATFSTKRVICEALIPTDVSSLFLKVRLLCSDSNYFSIFECCFHFALFPNNQHVSKSLYLKFAVNLHVEQALCLLKNGPF
jgi:hypothetical protein